MKNGSWKTRCPLGKSRLVGGLIFIFWVTTLDGCSPQTVTPEERMPVVAAFDKPADESETPALLGYALAVPGVEAAVTVDEEFLRGDLAPFKSAEGGGTLHLVGNPPHWQPRSTSAAYVVLVLELARIARAPTLYLVLLERQGASFVQRSTERLGEKLLLTGVEFEADTVQVRALDARLGRLPAKRGLGSHLHVFKLVDGSLQRLEP